VRRRLGDAVAVLLLPLPAVILTIRLRARGLSCGVIVNPLDVRLINYLLEWGYQHLLRVQFPNTGLWSPPFFYPTTHALGYSDTFISSYPFYFAGRILGASPAAALLAYQLLQLALTAVVAYLCARWIGLARLPSFLCAQCFAWGWPRYNQLAHLQFASGWVVPLFYASLYLAWRQRRPWLLALAAWTVCAAFYTSVYVAYFLLLASMVAVARQSLKGAGPGFDRTIAVGFTGCVTAFVVISLVSNVITEVIVLWYYVAFAAAAYAVIQFNPARRDAGRR